MERTTSNPTPEARGARPRKAARKSPSRKAAPRRRTAGARKAPKKGALESLLRRLAAQAEQAGSKIAAASERGTDNARRAAKRSAAATRRAASAITGEWKKLDTARRIELVAALLGALAAASSPLLNRKRGR